MFVVRRELLHMAKIGTSSSSLTTIYKNDLGLFSSRKITSLWNFQKFKNYVKKQRGHHIKVLRSDRGKEYNYKEFDKFCDDEGVEHQLTVGYTPEQNDVFERKNRIVMEMASAMLKEKGLPYTFWAEAAYTAVYLLYRCLTKTIQKKTPVEAWSGRKPSTKHL